MIFVGLGSNLPGEGGVSPAENVRLALKQLQARGVKVVATSPFYKSEPVPKSDQPWFVNAVAHIETNLSAVELLSLLHTVEAAFGRTRRTRNEARILDLDLLDYRGQVISDADAGLNLPHPRMHQRRFVLKPLADIAPAWCHPASKKTISALLAALSEEGQTVPL